MGSISASTRGPSWLSATAELPESSIIKIRQIPDPINIFSLNLIWDLSILIDHFKLPDHFQSIRIPKIETENIFIGWGQGLELVTMKNSIFVVLACR